MNIDYSPLGTFIIIPKHYKLLSMNDLINQNMILRVDDTLVADLKNNKWINLPVHNIGEHCYMIGSFVITKDR